MNWLRMGRALIAFWIGISACPLASAGAAEHLATSATATHPNIIVFLVDDMGWQDTSVPFWSKPTALNRKFHTPNMEQLAAGGMKFTSAYACCVCTPSRVSLMTGLNAARHGVTNWTLYKDTPTDARHPSLKIPPWNVNGLCATAGVPRTVEAVTLPSLLAMGGYRTIHVGKAHFGAVGTPGEEPRNLGFDVNIGGHAAGGPGSYLSEQGFGSVKDPAKRVWHVPGLEKYENQHVFLTEALTREANAAVDQAVQDGKPFYLYMAHYAVHVPYAPDDRFIKKYLDAGLDRTEAMYAALVEGMDKSLGDILANVERHGLTDKTVILFMSDNGGLSAHGRGGKPHTHNAPLSSGKGSAREGGLRVPMIVKWPGVTKAASVSDTPVIIEDFFPTILQIAGVADIPGGIDGVSFVPLLRGAPDSRSERPLIWHYPNNWGPTGPGLGPFSAIRLGDWKLIYYHADRRYELFNLKDDISESHNLAAAEPAVASRLAARLRQYLTTVKAQMPLEKKTGQPVPLPGGSR